ncbi:hypothetical protein ASF10_22365 [Flavobacterium sp. Leaf82]|uniref:hypothetical protein n=1 Tax=unclassified Flavobacterium TaxID=196869 RepID=UPI0006F6D668|nr:hypothetical protein [Flavobacterium sp. Leaf82]KQO30748.1 hypothetical protein ASF10_22365 [Flavobacterium sp. Leaf82]
MFTDIYFTNLGPTLTDNDICFSQNISKVISLETPFKVISGCQYAWSHTFRIPWDLHFCFIKSSGTISESHSLWSISAQQKKKTLISKEGIVTVMQDYQNGKQVFDFEQTKGNVYSGVQLYRGSLLVATKSFTQNHAQIDLDTTIFLVENRHTDAQKNAQEYNANSIQSFDFTGLKAVHVFLVHTKDKRELTIRKTEHW